MREISTGVENNRAQEYRSGEVCQFRGRENETERQIGRLAHRARPKERAYRRTEDWAKFDNQIEKDRERSRNIK